MPTRTKFVYLMHPKEFKHEKAGTGRLTHLCLATSEIHMGLTFDTHELVQALIADPANFPVLVYPGPTARNLTTGALSETDLGGRRLVLFLLDGTWSGARKMLRLSPSLQRLPRVMFTPSAPSRFIIKQQPQAGCLSTLETTHELLVALEKSGLDAYPLPAQLHDLFARMQAYQIRCASDPALAGYRRRAYRTPAERVLTPIRRRYIPTPVEAPSPPPVSVPPPLTV
jgi:DTW domain-containing protein YfiP